MIPLPLDSGDGRLIWNPSRLRDAVVTAADGGAVVEWRDGTDTGTLYTERADRVLAALRSLYPETWAEIRADHRAR